MTRYERIIERLDKLPEQNKFICKSMVCACLGCAGSINGKAITERELELYLSGEMKKMIAEITTKDVIE